MSQVRVSIKLAPMLAAILILPVLVALGFWQLDRAKEKRDLQQEYDRRANDEAIRITAQPQPVEALRFYRVIVTGEYDSEFQILLDNKVHRAQAGYHVLTPVKISGGDTRILINRGWIPLGDSRTDLPIIQTPSGVVTITGLATVPLKGGFHLGPADRTDQQWYPVWQYLELERYQERVPFAIQPVVLLLDPDSPAGGFEREWQRLDTGIAVHQGYAFQWFSLAIALLIIVLFFNFRDAGNKIVE